MKYPVRNTIYEKVKQAGNMTDTELIRALEKEDNSISLTKYCFTSKYTV